MHEEIHPLTESQQNALLAVARKESLRDYYFLLAALHTDLRPVELAALNWSEIDFQRRLILVRFTLSKDGKRGEPKTKSSVRDIHLSRVLAGSLPEWRDFQAKKIGNTEIVFSGLNRAGTKRINIGFMRKIVNRYLKSAGVQKHIRLHDLRRSFATTMLEKGAPIERVSKMLGHASIQVTSDVYYRYKPTPDDFDYL